MAAIENRTALKLRGANTPSAALTTMKFTPQRRTISASRASVRVKPTVRGSDAAPAEAEVSLGWGWGGWGWTMADQSYRGARGGPTVDPLGRFP
jgi:hypothetical protein